MRDDVFTLDKLKAMFELVKDIPPPPFLASSKLLPADRALSFECDGRQHVGAHPDFWAKIPPGTINPNGPFDLQIVNLDFNRGTKMRFYSAMAHATDGNAALADETVRTDPNPLPRTPDAQT